jgi:predicted acylesterase/phospholipase RssA/ABC-type phosphate/phosphonate transport system substrate-binding protein
MKSRTLTAILLVPLWIVLANSLSLAQNSAITNAPKSPTIIKVGITEYSKGQSTYNNYDRLFRELAASSDSTNPVTFTFALGTYREVRDWYDKGLIEVAILSAMPVGELLLAGQSRSLAAAYVGDISVSSAPSPDSILPLASNAANNDPDAAYKYRPICIGLRSDDKLQAIAKDDDPISRLRELWNDGQLKFLFVRPYSVSGYIVPMKALRDNKINPLDTNNPLEKIEFTYEHFKSLERLVKPDAPEKGKPQHVVAFVLDDARFNLRQQFGAPEDVFLRIPIKGLDDFTIPREMVLANYHQDNVEVAGSENKFTRTKKLMQHLFANWKKRLDTGVLTRPPNAPIIKYKSQPDWDSYASVRKMLDEFSLPRELLQRATLDDLINDLISWKSPRLAVVLSGGGAKCAYQAGAIIGIEKKLKKKVDDRTEELKKSGMPEADIQQEISALSKKLDISLVVGTSGGAINALLVAMGATRPDSKNPDNAGKELSGAWKSFNQQQFLRPSRRFRVLFGLCFGILQALVVAIAVLLFGRQTMNWTATIVLLIILGLLEFFAALYFHLATSTILLLFAVETVAILLIIAGVILVDRLLRRWTRRGLDKSQPPVSDIGDSDTLRIESVERESQHWRQLTIILLLLIGVLEALFAITPGLERLINPLPYNHWIDHGWTAALLTAKWSYPYPLVIAIIMALIGWKLFRKFDWNRWREPLVLWTGILLVGLATLLVLDGLFRGSSASRVDGIEEAMLAKMPDIIRRTINPGFHPPDDTLRSLSHEILAKGLIQRDLIITSSKLPVAENTNPRPVNSLPDDVNSLPDDLYFYYRSGSLKPPPDQSFIPLKYNSDMLLDVVIGSSTIYPIFPSRRLSNITLGPDVGLGVEEKQRKTIASMRIIDGGFIHNIPIEAAQRWGATHIIVIEASPARQQRADPRDLWDHALTAFGYLFDQAQRTDMLAQGQGTAAFILRPTSECEKLNAKPICTDNPDPNLDTFDFSERAASHAFDRGLADVESPLPLFFRVSGAPRWFDPDLNKPQPLLAVRLPSHERQQNPRRILR